MALTYHHVTVAGAGDNSGDSWANAMALADWVTDMGSMAAGDVFWVAGGTYTLTGNVAPAADGTSTDLIFMVGVKSTTTNEGAAVVAADIAYGEDRPLIVAAANDFNFDNFIRMSGFKVETTDAAGFGVDTVGMIDNCSSFNSSGTASRLAIDVSSNSAIINCDGCSINGTAINTSGSFEASVLFNYAHDSLRGIHCSGDNRSIIGNVVDSCVVGINLSDEFHHAIVNNTIYGCTIGIENVTQISYGNRIINNIINDCTTGISWFAVNTANFYMYNNLEGNGTKTTNVPTVLPGWDAKETNNDPAFVRTLGGTDLACSDHAGPDYTVTSANGGFTADMVDDYFYVLDDGTSNHFVPGIYLVASHTDTNTIALTADPTDGTNEVAGDFSCRDFRLPSGSDCVNAGLPLPAGVGL